MRLVRRSAGDLSQSSPGMMSLSGCPENRINAQNFGDFNGKPPIRGKGSSSKNPMRGRAVTTRARSLQVESIRHRRLVIPAKAGRSTGFPLARECTNCAHHKSDAALTSTSVHTMMPLVNQSGSTAVQSHGHSHLAHARDCTRMVGRAPQKTDSPAMLFSDHS